MDSDEEEERQLRAVARETARSILYARQRAERELLATKEALERKTEQLAHSLGVLRATLEATFDGIVVTDGEGQITGFNEKYLQMWSIPRELIAAGEHQRALAWCVGQLGDGGAGYVRRIEQIYSTSPAETRDVLELTDGRVYERCSRLQELDHRTIGRVWSFRDITEQRRAETALREQREWFQVTLGSIADAVIATDTEGKVTFLNPVAEKMTGCPSAEAIGAPLDAIFNIVNEYTHERVQSPVAQVLREGIVVDLVNHAVLLAQDGREIPIEDSAAPIRDGTGAICGAVMVFHDVTARRHAETALRDADRRKDEFLATLAHELRNPLAPIRQATFISQTPGATEAQKRWSHEVVDRQVKHMSLLLDDLLDISRITRGSLVLRSQATELASMIEAALETVRPLMDAKRHRLSVETPHEPVRFSADPLRIAQVLSNLLTNAAKYTDPEGVIRLTATETHEEVIIRIVDSGIGISAEALPRVFEMFAQVSSARDRSEGGLGIGLALTKGLVELHGGTIEARSAGIGRGSQFTVRLPRKLGVQNRGTDSPTHEPPRNASRRVLLADDNQDAAQTLAEVLRLKGHAVRMVHDGPEALAVFAEFRPDVVLLDIGMPGLNGYEVARHIRDSRSASTATLVAITGWAQEGDKTRAYSAGFDHHLTKPVEVQNLLDLIQSEARCPSDDPS
jgi:PAS domain S-box-containing protein